MSNNETALKQAQAHEPFVRMVKRDSISRPKAWLTRAIALVGALLVGAVVIAAMGHNPLAVYWNMVTGSLGNKIVRPETIRIVIPLLVVGLGIGIAFKMRFWNIGGEGQIIAGAIGATYFALFQYQNIPRVPLLILMALASIICGGIWGLIPAFFKARWGTNETLFTLMLNYIALEGVKYLQAGPWRDPRQQGFPIMAMFDDIARLPKVLGVNIGWIIALALVVLVYFYINKSKQGYEITVVGESVPTAHYAGMNVSKIIIRTMFISGAVCGLAGFLIVSGATYNLSESVTGGVGFTAITVAWLAKLNPVVMIVISFFLAILQKGSNAIQTVYKIPSSVADILTGLILFFMLACEFFLNYKLIFRKGGSKP